MIARIHNQFLTESVEASAFFFPLIDQRVAISSTAPFHRRHSLASSLYYLRDDLYRRMCNMRRTCKRVMTAFTWRVRTNMPNHQRLSFPSPDR